MVHFSYNVILRYVKLGYRRLLSLFFSKRVKANVCSEEKNISGCILNAGGELRNISSTEDFGDLEENWEEEYFKGEPIFKSMFE